MADKLQTRAEFRSQKSGVPPKKPKKVTGKKILKFVFFAALFLCFFLESP